MLTRLLPLLGVCALAWWPRPAAPAQDPAWLGCWQEQGGASVYLFEAERCAELVGSQAPRFFRVRYGAEAADSSTHAWLESWAQLRRWELIPEGELLRLREGQVERLLEPLAETPAALLVPPYELPEAAALDGELVIALQETLRERRAADQRVRADGRIDDPGEMVRVDDDNTLFLLSLIQDLGWIDATRFGPEASDAAFLIVQHTSDLRLQRTALPWIEKDARAHRISAQSYALLHDRLQLHLGHRQRYGSQIGITPEGVRVLMPCEDPARVDALRAELGMVPLADYLAYFQHDQEPVKRLEEVVPIPPR